MYISAAKGFVLVYDITQKSTLDELSQIAREIRDISRDNVAMVVAGNKTDIEGHRQTTKREGEIFSKSIKASFFETSAKTGDNIDALFIDLVRKIRRQEKKESKTCLCMQKNKKKLRRKKCKVL
mmetsp:Transcript_6624/g.7207  ORF Transcript_6624/g.7207 Transcript_6624/m.7207 type:complete len:124 (+) Transcript_6624:351-722(+)